MERIVTKLNAAKDKYTASPNYTIMLESFEMLLARKPSIKSAVLESLLDMTVEDIFLQWCVHYPENSVSANAIHAQILINDIAQILAEEDTAMCGLNKRACTQCLEINCPDNKTKLD